MARRVRSVRVARGPMGPRMLYRPPMIIGESIFYEHEPDEYVNERRELDEAGGAGDLLPTSPLSVRTALDQENANWLSLYDAVLAALTAGSISTDFSFPFTNDLAAWKIFYALNMQQTPFGWEPMAQLEEWRKKRARWALDLEARVKFKLPGNLDEAPPREKSTAFASMGDLTGLIVAAGVVAAIVVFGPRLAKE